MIMSPHSPLLPLVCWKIMVLMSSGPATLMPYTMYEWEPKRSTLLTFRNC